MSSPISWTDKVAQNFTVTPVLRTGGQRLSDRLPCARPVNVARWDREVGVVASAGPIELVAVVHNRAGCLWQTQHRLRQDRRQELFSAKEERLVERSAGDASFGRHVAETAIRPTPLQYSGPGPSPRETTQPTATRTRHPEQAGQTQAGPGAGLRGRATGVTQRWPAPVVQGGVSVHRRATHLGVVLQRHCAVVSRSCTGGTPELARGNGGRPCAIGRRL